MSASEPNPGIADPISSPAIQPEDSLESAASPSTHHHKDEIEPEAIIWGARKSALFVSFRPKSECSQRGACRSPSAENWRDSSFYGVLRQKGGKSVRYHKPQIVSCRRALELVQRVEKGPIPTPDSGKLRETPAAYEADE